MMHEEGGEGFISKVHCDYSSLNRFSCHFEYPLRAKIALTAFHPYFASEYQVDILKIGLSFVDT